MAEASDALKRVCPRCTRPASRLINGQHCVSCYNRQREVLIGRNRKGTAPKKLLGMLHPEVLAVAGQAGTEATVHLAASVASRVEAMLMLARKATGPICFGAAPLAAAG